MTARTNTLNINLTIERLFNKAFGPLLVVEFCCMGMYLVFNVYLFTTGLIGVLLDIGYVSLILFYVCFILEDVYQTFRKMIVVIR